MSVNPALVPPAPDALGEIVAGCAPAPDRVLLLGWLRGALPDEAAATCEATTAKGRYRTFAWPHGVAPDARWFLLAVQLAELAERGRGRTLLLHAPDSRSHDIAKLPDEWTPEAAFAARLREALGEHVGGAIDFLRAGFAGPGGRPAGGAAGVLGQLLHAAARHRGAIELRGAIDGVGLYIQGWGIAVGPGRAELLIEHERLDEAEGYFATFARSDLETPAQGVVGVIPRVAVAAEAVRRVWLRGEQGYQPLDMFAGGSLLDPDQTVAQLRGILPSLRAPREAARLLRRVARPRFSGQDTLSGHAEPVRAAVDLAVAQPGAGYYLTGWVLDPARRLSGLALRDAASLVRRLDGDWTRVPRPDVTAGFREDRRFAGLLGEDDRHGFTVFVPAPEAEAGGRGHHLEFEFGEDDCAFLPLRFENGETPQAQRRLLASFDIHKPSAGEIVERHLGPLFDAALRRPARPAPARAAEARPAVEADTVLLVPLLANDPVRVTPFLAQFGVHRLDDRTRMLVVCGGAVERATQRAVERCLDFYGVDARTIAAPEAFDPGAALQAGVAASASPRLLFLSPSIFVERADWIAALRAALAAEAGAGAVSPTVLHEDYAIKFAGVEDVRAVDAPPFGELRARFAGYPRGWTEGHEAAPVLAGALDCCLLLREAVEAAGGVGAGPGLPATQALRLFLAMRRRGFAALWTPAVEVYDLGDPAADGDDYWLKTRRWVDGWCLRRTWDGQAARPDSPLLRTVA